MFSGRPTWSVQTTLTDILYFFEVVVIRPHVYEIFSSFVELFGHSSPHGYFFFDCKVFKGLRYERQFTQGHLAYRTWRRTEREESVDAGFAPGIFRELSTWFTGEIEEERRTFYDSMN